MITNSTLPVRVACSTLEVSKSAYYETHAKEPTEDKDRVILDRIRIIASDFSRYGYRRITKELKRNNLVVNHKRVHRIMKEHSLLVKRKRFTPITTQSNHSLPRYDNLIKGKVIVKPNEVWVSDITYIPMQNEFVYLALIMDLYSRKVVGWDLSRDVDTTLTLTALNNTVRLRGKDNIKGCIHHSDHGMQYLSGAYMDKLHELGILPSMGKVGNSYDNAHAESLNKTIKWEEVWINEYKTFEQAYEGIAEFIKKYNAKRLHSAIGYVPPDEFEHKN